MKTYQVTLPDEFAVFVDRMIAEKKWDAVDDLMLTAVAQLYEEMKQHEEMTDEEKETLRKALRVGVEQLDRGESVDGEEFMDRLITKLRSAGQPS